MFRTTRGFQRSMNGGVPQVDQILSVNSQKPSKYDRSRIQLPLVGNTADIRQRRHDRSKYDRSRIQLPLVDNTADVRQRDTLGLLPEPLAAFNSP